MIITFCGHSRHIGDAKDESKLLALFDELSNGEDITFYLGGYGDFDFFCKDCAKKYKAQYLNVIGRSFRHLALKRVLVLIQVASLRSAIDKHTPLLK